LEEESSLLTTFSTPFWEVQVPRRAPRLLRNLPETTCQALEGLMGVSCMAEDVLILGVGDTLDKST